MDFQTLKEKSAELAIPIAGVGVMTLSALGIRTGVRFFRAKHFCKKSIEEFSKNPISFNSSDVVIQKDK